MAKEFAGTVLSELASGTQLSLAVQRGRLSMVAGQRMGPRAVPEFTMFIPVQLGRNRADPTFNVAADRLESIRLQKRLEIGVEKVEPLLARDVDPDIEQVLSAGTGVVVVDGPAECGKSTTVRGRVAALLAAANNTSRYLYYSAKTMTWTTDIDRRVRQLLDALAIRFRWLTIALKTLLDAGVVPNDDDAVSALATWLGDEARVGRRSVVILDDVPDDVAGRIVSRASNAIDAGLLLVVARAPHVRENAAVAKTIGMQFMNADEIARIAVAPDVLQRTGGLPYFVAAIARGGPLDASALTARLAALPAAVRHATHLSALSAIGLPRAPLDAIAGVENIASLVAEHLLSESGGRLIMPEVVRDAAWRAFANDDIDGLRGELYDLLLAGGPNETELELEAMRQALELAKGLAAKSPDESEKRLDDAMNLGDDLHGKYTRDGNVVAVKAMWDRYHKVTSALGRAFDPEADLYFADALAGVGMLQDADDLLDAVISASEQDENLVKGLILRSNVIKRLGGQGAFQQRVDLLSDARMVAEKLVEENPDDEEHELRLANVDQSLGNTYGYGSHADVDKAKQHLRKAAEVFDRLGDLRGHRARAEQIEILRYNDRLSENERAASIITLQRQLDDLVMRSMRRDAVLHLYEIGRLDCDLARRVVWFRRAYERAAGSYAPLDIHAALQWKLAEMECGADVEEEVANWVRKLERFPADAWSLRLRRRAIATLARRAAARNDTAAQAEKLRGAWAIVHDLHARGESRRDRAARLEIAADGQTILARDDLLASTLDELRGGGHG